MNIYDHAYGLVRALKESPEYKKFIAAKGKIDGDDRARGMLEDFQRKRLIAQQAQIFGQELPKETEEELEKLYEVISLNPKISEYLQAEYGLAKILADIQKIIGEAFGELGNSM